MSRQNKNLELPVSTRNRAEVITVSKKSHHRPKSWKKLEEQLEYFLWIDSVRYDKQAYNAPQNGVKLAREKNKDGKHIFWIHLYESEDTTMAVSIETTGYTEKHAQHTLSILQRVLN